MPRNETKKRGINREHVRNTAKNAQKGGSSIVRTPDGVSRWMPEKKDTYFLRFIPYTVTLPNHPDGVEVGEMWYRRPYALHFNVGGSDRPAICLKSIGQKCPICEEVKRLSENYDNNEKVIKDIKAKHSMLYLCFNPREPEKLIVFDWSAFKFSDKLETELAELCEDDLDNLGFADIEGGKVIKFRVGEGTFSGGKFLVTDKVDFVDAKAFTDLEDEIVDNAPSLDDMLVAMDYDTLKKLFHGVETEETEETNGEEEEDAPPPVKKKAPTSSRRAPPPPPVEEEEEETPFEEEDSPAEEDKDSTGVDEDGEDIDNPPSPPPKRRGADGKADAGKKAGKPAAPKEEADDWGGKGGDTW